MTLPVAYLSNRLYVPSEYVQSRHVNPYTYRIGPGFESDNPEDYQAILTYRQFRNGYYGFPRGDLGKMQEIFEDEFQIEDERTKVRHGYDLQFTGELRPEQQEVWETWTEYKYGLIEAPARFGKTILMVYMLCELRQKCLVLAQEWSLLEQFEEELRRFTNINQLERRTITELGRKKGRLVGKAKKITDVFPIVTLATWQAYAHHIPELVAMRDNWGLVFIDEAHSCAAPCFSKVVNTLNSYYRVPVTATPTRKDGLECVVRDIAGPVTARGTTEQLPVDVRVVHTGIPQPNMRNGVTRAWWIGLRRKMARHEERNQVIVARVMKDLANGHKVLVVSDLIAHLNTLYKMLENEKLDGKPLRVKILDGDVHGDQRKGLRHAAKAGKIDVVLAYSRIVQLGWNVPPWSSIHNVLPMSNEQNWYQRVSRIRTPCKNCPGVKDDRCMSRGLCGKKPPIAHIYVDSGKVVTGCYHTMKRVHDRLGFRETHEYLDIGTVKFKRDPKRAGRGLLWSEISS